MSLDLLRFFSSVNILIYIQDTNTRSSKSWRTFQEPGTKLHGFWFLSAQEIPKLNRK